jgi:translation elongation factor EF-4
LAIFSFFFLLFSPIDSLSYKLFHLTTQERRGEYIELKYVSTLRSVLVYDIPLSEIITDFFDEMKSKSKGFASMEYSPIGYRVSDLVRLDIKVNGEDAPPLSSICHSSQVRRRRRRRRRRRKTPACRRKILKIVIFFLLLIMFHHMLIHCYLQYMSIYIYILKFIYVIMAHAYIYL